MSSDIEIARQVKPRPIGEIAEKCRIPEVSLHTFGRHKAKIDLDYLDSLPDNPDTKLILVTGITPTPAGEGKTTTTVGLGDALNKIGNQATICLREPSLGPCFGVKGGAAGGGHAQVIPMEDINLHFTGDFHAITSAHNLLSAMLDNHIYWGNTLGIDARRVHWRRVVDLNDRALRSITQSLGGAANGFPREDGFDITVASEVMAIFCLAESLPDLKEKLGNIIVAETRDRTPVTAAQLEASGAMTVLLKEAFMPNLVQTLENNIAFVHGGPFANIAHGNSSVVADLVGLKLVGPKGYVLTEAGFGADMGAERFFNIKCRYSGLAPDAAVLVATVRGLKAHSGNHKIVPGKPLPEDLLKANPDEVHQGGDNLRKQLENMQVHGCTPVVAINVFPGDHDEDIAAIHEIASEFGARAAVSTHFSDGGRGATELAAAIKEAAEEESNFQVLYPDDASLKDKIHAVATKVYGADGVEYSAAADNQLANYTAQGFDNLPVCIAKQHLSLSHDAKLKGAPKGWTLPVREVRASVGAGFVYPICGDMRTMPGLGTTPAAMQIDIDDNGDIVNLS